MSEQHGIIIPVRVLPNLIFPLRQVRCREKGTDGLVVQEIDPITNQQREEGWSSTCFGRGDIRENVQPSNGRKDYVLWPGFLRPVRFALRRKGSRSILVTYWLQDSMMDLRTFRLPYLSEDDCW